jgi:hypothetical protein
MSVVTDVPCNSKVETAVVGAGVVADAQLEHWHVVRPLMVLTEIEAQLLGQPSSAQQPFSPTLCPSSHCTA